MEENQVHPVEPPPVSLASGNDPSRLPEVEGLGWNWAGFLLPYLWLVGHGQASAGLVLMLSAGVPFVSFLHLLVYPLTAIYLGLNGYEVAWKSQPYHSVRQLQDKEREWIIWGVLINLMVFVGLVLSMLYLRAFFGQMMQSVEEMGW